MHDPDRPTGGPPTTCPACGSKLGPRLILNGWEPCGCDAPHRRGHTIVRCVACMAVGWTTVRYEPYHRQRGHPVARG